MNNQRSGYKHSDLLEGTRDEVYKKIEQCFRKIHLRQQWARETGLNHWEVGFMINGYTLEEARHFCKAYGKPTTEKEINTKIPNFETLNIKKNRPKRESEQEIELIEEVFKHYREVGFPYLKCLDKDLFIEFKRLQKTPSVLELENNNLKQNMVGVSLLNSFHPEIMGMMYGDFKTPEEVFKDDGLFKKAILNRIRYGESLKSWEIRKAISSLKITKKVPVFRPTIAKSIIEYFKPKLVVDFSAEWGGRALGAMVCNVNYIGIDSNNIVWENNKAMVEKVRSFCPDNLRIDLICDKAEGLIGKRKFNPDMVFSSLPYSGLGEYGNVSVCDLEDWHKNFWDPCILGAATDLPKNGRLVLGVDQRTQDRTISVAISCGFVLECAWKMQMSQYQSSSGMENTEPILVFKKV